MRLQRGLPLQIHGDGSHRRSFLHVRDVIRAMALVDARGAHGTTYNIGCDHEWTNDEVADLMLALHPGGGRKERVEDRRFNDCRYLIDDSRLRALGWSPQIPFEEGLYETMLWYGAHGGRWETPNLEAHPVAPTDA